MKKFDKQWAQGDLLAIRIEKLPEGLVKSQPVNGKVIVAHSETGHHHVMDARTVEMYRLPEEIYECFLVVHEPTPLIHERLWDTHEAVLFDRSVYKIRRQREHTPEGWRRVED